MTVELINVLNFATPSSDVRVIVRQEEGVVFDEMISEERMVKLSRDIRHNTYYGTFTWHNFDGDKQAVINRFGIDIEESIANAIARHIRELLHKNDMI
ncbi:MAG: hypothetical protein ACFB0B_15320 [Thermonemataceae bacterium]